MCYISINKTLFEKDFIEEFKRELRKYKNKLDLNKNYSLVIEFYNPIKNISNINRDSIIDFDINDIIKNKQYRELIYKIKKEISSIVTVGCVELYGRNKLINNYLLKAALKETTNTECKNKIIENYDLYIFKHKKLFLKKLLNKGVIDYVQYNNSLINIAKENYI